jgi:hypothetical protein
MTGLKNNGSDNLWLKFFYLGLSPASFSKDPNLVVKK